jgi:hypothetical protein
MRESFDECVMFHLLTVFPNNAAEQEKYSFPMCSRSPSGLAYAILYSVWSNSTPTSCSYPAGTTAQATSPADADERSIH